MAARNIKELLKRTRERRKAQITLSTGDVIELFFVPLTEAEDEKIREAVADDKRSNAYGLRVLVNKAEYEDGQKMFALADIPTMRQEYAKSDLTAMMEALVFNGGVLAKEDPKSDKGGDQE
jgi:hypothetical protein